MKLNIGCGCVWLPGYINVDREDYEQLCAWAKAANKPAPVVGSAEFQQRDLILNWPWQDNTCDEILADNFLEHLNPAQLTHVLREALRVLSPGGIITGRVPNFTRIFRLYEDRSKWEWFPGATYGPYKEPSMNALHNYIYGWGHQQVFTTEMLRLRLSEAGFITTVEPVEDVGLLFVAKKGETV